MSCNDLEHDRDRPLDLLGLVKQLSSDRERDRSQFAFAQLENERAQHYLRDELSEARQDISPLSGGISDLQARADSQHRGTVISWRCSRARGFFTVRNPELVIRPKPADVELRMR